MTLYGRYVLFVGLLMSSIALVTYPYLPQITQHFSAAQAMSVPLASEEVKAVDLSVPVLPGLVDTMTDEEPKEEHLYRLHIPKIDVDTSILESNSIAILDKQEGVWREPYTTANPTTEGNMVIAGHRFQYLPPNKTTFYNLDKIKEGDEIFVKWGTEEYRYVVTKSFIVKPQQTEIRQGTPGKKELTLYTCTPIGSNALRLVIRAELQAQEKEIPNVSTVQ